jgi:hypothetical protein
MWLQTHQVVSTEFSKDSNLIATGYVAQYSVTFFTFDGAQYGDGCEEPTGNSALNLYGNN